MKKLWVLVAAVLLLSSCEKIALDQPGREIDFPPIEQREEPQREIEKEKTADELQVGRLRALGETLFAREEEARAIYEIQNMRQNEGRLLVTEMDKGRQRALCGLENCIHRGPECHAWLEDTFCTLAATGNGKLHLVYWGYSDGADVPRSYIVQLDIATGARRVLISLPEGQTFGGNMFTDGEWLFLGRNTDSYQPGAVPGQQVLEQSVFEMVAVNLTTGELHLVFDYQEYSLVGVYQDQFVCLTQPEHGFTMEYAYDDLVLFSPANGQAQVLRYGPFSVEEAGKYTCVYQDRLYGVGGSQHFDMALVQVDIATGQEKNLLGPTDENLVFEFGNTSFYGQAIYCKIRYLDTYTEKDIVMNLETGEEMPSPLQLTIQNNTGPAIIYLENDTQYLVLSGMMTDRYPYTEASGNKTAYTSNRLTYALVGKADYWAGIANYTPIEMVE